MSTDAYVRTTYQGHVVNRRTKALLEVFNDRVGESEPVTMTQGSYNLSVSASAGTHDGGGAFDLTSHNWRRRVTLLRDLGVAAWHRPELYRADGTRVWGEHIHCIVAGDKELSPAARAQIADYRDHLDGLADGARDDFPHHPVLKPFDYPRWLRERARMRRLWRALTAAIAKLVQARADARGQVSRRWLGRAVQRLRRRRDAVPHH